MYVQAAYCIAMMMVALLSGSTLVSVPQIYTGAWALHHLTSVTMSHTVNEWPLTMLSDGGRQTLHLSDAVNWLE